MSGRRASNATSLIALRREVLDANLELSRRGLAPFTFGNASAIDRENGLVVIKPSGVPYTELTADNLVVTDLDGRVVEGTLRPSSDLPTHLVLYRALKMAGGVVHTHSHFATVWAQAGREIPCLGTTHADYFNGSVPITLHLTTAEIAEAYEANTGEAIVRRLDGMNRDDASAVLVAGHGSFCWAGSVTDAVETASVLEEVARLAYHTVVLESAVAPIPDALMERHFTRKHGPGAYYGQG